MRITEKHANGATITVSGFRAKRVVEEWRKAQNAPEPAVEAPKVTGTSASFERAHADSYPMMNGSGRWTPTVFGFTVEEQS
jgi:hypothetical protein